MRKRTKRCWKASLVVKTVWLLVVGSLFDGEHRICNAFSMNPRCSASGFHLRALPTEEGAVSQSEGEDRSPPKREVQVSATLNMPFSAEVAYDTFCDLPRQPLWSNWLKSVEYISDESFQEEGVKSKWTVGFRGLRFSWNAVTTRLERPRIIEWESTSGLKNKGRVDFEESKDGTHDMTLQMTFIAPRIAARIFRRNKSITSFVERRMIRTTLVNFRSVVLDEH